MNQVRGRGARLKAIALVSMFLTAGILIFLPHAGAGSSLDFATTSDFDSGSKGSPGDGNYNVETTTDNPGVALDRLELANLKGDNFTVPDADANTFKWDVPLACTQKSPTTIIRDVAGGALALGANKASGPTQVGVVASAGIMGDFSSSVDVIKVTTQPTSQIAFQFLNTATCQWQGKKSASGAMYLWDEGSTVDGTFGLRAYTISKGVATIRGSQTLLTMPQVWLRIQRSSTTWTFSYSANGVTWTMDESATFTGPTTVYQSFFVTDPKAGVTTTFHLDEYHLAAATLMAGGFRTSGDWTSPAFTVPSSEGIDRIEIAGTFTATYALDRVQILLNGVPVLTSEADNAFVVPVPGAPRLNGAGFAVQVFLKGDGLGTPVLSRVSVYFDAFFPTSSESVSLGSSTGIANQAAPDGVHDTKTEALGGVEATVGVTGQGIARGTQSSGAFPADLTASDDTYVQYTETTVPAEVTYKQGSFVRKTDGPGTQTISGVGLEGRAILLYWTAQSTFGKGSGLSSGIGFATGSSQFSVAWAADPAASPSNTGRHSSGDAIAILLNGTPVLDGAADLVGFTPDGFVLSWTTNPNPARATIIHYVVLGPGIQQAFVGQFVGPAAGVVGNQAYTGVGFQGDVAFFLGSLQTSIGDATGSGMAFGVAAGASQAAINVAMPDGSTTNPTRSIQSNARVLMELDPSLTTPALDQQAAFVSFDPDGFSLNHIQTTTGGILFWAMILKGGTYKLNYLVRQNVTGLQGVSGVGFQPDGVLFFSDLSTKLLGHLDTGAEITMGAGSVVGGVPVQDSIWGGENDANNPTHANEFTSNAQVLMDESLSSTATQNAARYQSSDPDGFTLNWTATQTNATQKFFYLAIQAQIPSGQLDIRYDFASIGYRSAGDVLAVEGHTADEGLVVQIWDWSSSSWTTAGSIDSATDVTVDHTLAATEISSSYEVMVRLTGAVESGDLVQSDFWIDYLAIEKHEFHLQVVDGIDGIVGSGPFTLHLVAGLGSTGDNFDVFVYDYGTASWGLWMSAPFTSSDASFTLALSPSQMSSGPVQIMFVDHGTVGLGVPGVLSVDVLEVETPL